MGAANISALAALAGSAIGALRIRRAGSRRLDGSKNLPIDVILAYRISSCRRKPTPEVQAMMPRIPDVFRLAPATVRAMTEVEGSMRNLWNRLQVGLRSTPEHEMASHAA